jgi:hypothetical protein
VSIACSRPTASLCCGTDVPLGGATVERQLPLPSTSK